MRLLYRFNDILLYPLLLLILTIAVQTPARGEPLTQTNPDAANSSLTYGPPFSQENGGFSPAPAADEQKTGESVKISLQNQEVNENKLVNDDEENTKQISEQSPADQPQEEEAELLILKVTSKGYVMSYALAAYDLGDNIYLSLFDLSDALMFPIEVYDEEKRAEGWFIEKKNDFYLNIDAGELVIAGQRRDIAQDDVFINDEGMFISANALKDWFGLDTTLNYAEQKLDIVANDKLNFEAIVEREKRWEEKKKRKVRKRKTYDFIETPYDLVEYPTLTVQLGSVYANTAGEASTTGNYSVQGVGDLLYMSSDYFVTGNDRNQFNDARIRLYRYDEDGNALPAIGATKFELGDISPPSLNIVGGGGNERGVYVSNRGANSVTAPDNLLIDGEVEPGWEVEIYRNTEFIAFLDSTQTQSGRYEFTGLSLDAGNNTFKIVKYGPHGEKEVEYQRFLIGAGMLDEGQWNYDLSISQPGEQVIPVIDKDYKLDTSPRIIAGVEYGLLETLSFGGGIYSGPIFDETEHHGVTASVRDSTLGVYNRLDHFHTAEDQSISTLSTKTNVYDITISNFLAYYDGWDASEQDLEFSSETSLGTSVDVFGTGLSVRVGGGYEKYQTDRTITSLNNQISSSIFGYSFSNQIRWQNEENGGNNNETMVGELFFREYFKDIITGSDYGVLFRANLDYQLKPVSELSSLDIAAEKNLTEDIRMALGYSQSLGQSDAWSVNGRLSYDHEYFITDLSTQYNDQGDYSISANLRFNFGYDHDDKGYGLTSVRDAGRGTATAFVYHDVNYNNVFDDGDVPLEDVLFKSDNGNTGFSNEKGLATIKRQTSFRKTNLVLQSHTLPDIFMVPVKDGLQYIPRPGHLSHFEFPVVMGGEIDGELIATDSKRGRDFDFSEIQVEMLDMQDKVLKTVEADPTGYYLFEQVVPDSYKIRVVTESLPGLTLVDDKPVIVSVPKDDAVVNDVNISVILPPELSDEPYGPYMPGSEPAEQTPKAAPEEKEQRSNETPKEDVEKVVDKSADEGEKLSNSFNNSKVSSKTEPEVIPVGPNEEYITVPEERYRQNVAAPVMSVEPVDKGIGGPTPEESMESFPSPTNGDSSHMSKPSLPWLLNDNVSTDTPLEH